jgi:hypothetical protein
MLSIRYTPDTTVAAKIAASYQGTFCVDALGLPGKITNVNGSISTMSR